MRGAADSLSSSAYDGTDAVVSAKTAFKRTSTTSLPTVPPFQQSTLDAGPGSARRREGRRQHQRRGPDRRQGRRRRRHRPVLRRRASTREAGELSPFKLKEGRFATGPGQVVIDAGTADRENYSRRRHDRRSAPRARARDSRSPASPRSATSTRSAPRRSRCSTSTPRSGCSTSRVSYTEILVGGPDSVRKQLSESLGDSLQVQTAAAARPLHARRPEVVRELPEGVPARVRRHRRLRGRVHDLQHALDHGRAALA